MSLEQRDLVVTQAEGYDSPLDKFIRKITGGRYGFVTKLYVVHTEAVDPEDKKNETATIIIGDPSPYVGQIVKNKTS